MNVCSVIGGRTYGMSRITAAPRGPGGVLVVELAEQVVDESTHRGWLADDWAELRDPSPAVHDDT